MKLFIISRNFLQQTNSYKELEQGKPHIAAENISKLPLEDLASSIGHFS
jgi:hypothetical protein